jgi:hypothetical protein
MTTSIPTGVVTNLIPALTAVGSVTGSTFAMPAAPCMVTWQIILDTAPASCTIQLQASNDGSTWATVDTSTSTTSGRINTNYVAAPFIRARMTANSGGTTFSVTIIAKSLSASNPVGGLRVLNATAIAVANPADTNENTLFTGTIPANTLNANGIMARLRIWGTVAADGNTKTLRVKFGADTYTLFGGGLNGVSFYAEYMIMRTGVINVQTRVGMGTTGTTQPTTIVASIALTETADITVLVTGQNGTGSVANEIVLSAAILDLQGPIF